MLERHWVEAKLWIRVAAAVALVLGALAPMTTAAHADTSSDGDAGAAESGDADDEREDVCENPDTPFSDVPAAAAHASGIACLAAAGVVQGMDPTTYAPNRAVTREQMATLIARLLLSSGEDLPTDTDGNFDDIAGSLHAHNIEVLAAIGLVLGTGDETFSPGASITRGQLATIIVRTLDELDVTLSGEDSPFVDVDDDRTHAEAIGRLAAAGIATGHGDERYDPDGDVTRGQMASFLTRALDAGSIELTRLDPPVPPRAPEAGSKSTRSAPPESGATAQPSDPPALAGAEVTHGTKLKREHVGITTSKTDLSPSGPVTTSHDGQVIENLHITASGRDAWGVHVAHDDVTVRNVWIDHPNGGQGLDIDGDRFLVEHVTTDVVYLATDRMGHKEGSNNVGHRSAVISGDNGVFRRNHVVRARSAVKVGGNYNSIAENYVERLFNRDEPIYGPNGETRDWKLHGTSFANSSGEHHNTIARNRYKSGDSGGITMYSDGAPITDYLVIDNYAEGTGEGFPIIGGRNHSHADEIRDIRIEGNRFSGEFGWPSAVGDGTNAAVDINRPGNTFIGNRWVGSDEDLPARCGWQQNECQ